MEKLNNNTSESSSISCYDTTMDDNIHYQEKKRTTKRNVYKYGFQRIRTKGFMGIAIPQLSQLFILQDERAVLMNSNTIAFGNECLRLVNIAFHTSKVFPSLMGTCDTVTEYLQKELQQRHPKKNFHIIIGENDGFSFVINDSNYFADIKQEQYRVLIFSTKSNEKIKMDTHDANSQMKLRWKSVIFKKINN